MDTTGVDFTLTGSASQCLQVTHPVGQEGEQKGKHKSNNGGNDPHGEEFPHFCFSENILGSEFCHPNPQNGGHIQLNK